MQVCDDWSRLRCLTNCNTCFKQWGVLTLCTMTSLDSSIAASRPIYQLADIISQYWAVADVSLSEYGSPILKLFLRLVKMFGLVIYNGAFTKFAASYLRAEKFSVHSSVHWGLDWNLLRCKISCDHYMSLSQVLDNHIQQRLYMYNININIGYRNCLTLIIGIGIVPKNPISVGPYLNELL